MHACVRSKFHRLASESVFTELLIFLGFNTGDDPGNPRPDAWCDNCERVLIESGDKAVFERRAKVTVLCAGHYDRALEYNLRLVDLSRTTSPTSRANSSGFLLVIVLVAVFAVVGYFLLLK